FGGLTAVNDVSFEVERGSLVGLIGPNGAGKTTLFSLISGFEKSNIGSIWFDGVNITKYSPYRRVNQGITRTFQIVRPLKRLTCLDNVIVGCMSKRGKVRGQDIGVDQLASMILSSVGLIDKARIPPLVLPFGDLKKLEIARALASNPELLLLDEPFSGLSYEEQMIIVELITHLNEEGYTIIIAGHVLRELMTLVPRVLVMHQGKLIADGSPEDVAKIKIVIEAYLGNGESE
ncbi:MAG: ABC transporter ATP-binding protein, partial [Candidatus Heimdallarchaeota archaeon]|nr:ABC transporter ATP-binding protein [Candidatus Heimdallarchaeota archaeon]